MASTEHAGVVRTTTFIPAPGHREELLALFAEISDRARAADGCFGTQTCTVEEDPDVVVVISRWRDRESLRAFGAAEPVGGRLQGLLAEPPTTRHLTPVH